MNVRTCGVDIHRDMAEYVVLEWKDDFPNIISKGIIYKEFKNIDDYIYLKKLIKAFKVDFTAVEVGAYYTQERYNIIKRLKNIAVIKGACSNFSNMDDKIITGKIATKYDIDMYIANYKVAKYKLVKYSIVSIPVNDLMAIGLMAKEIKAVI